MDDFWLLLNKLLKLGGSRVQLLEVFRTMKYARGSYNLDDSATVNPDALSPCRHE